jgi:FkbM family methyltransferase
MIEGVTGPMSLDMVKLDVEGFEVEVLLGAEQAIGMLRPDRFIEFNIFTSVAAINRQGRLVRS